MVEEKTLSSRVLFQGRAVKLRLDTVLTGEGRRTTREVVEHADCIAVVAVDAGDNVLLVNQFRQAVGKSLLEIPAGGIDDGEDAATAVIRETREETGLRPGKVVRLGGFYSAPGYATEYLYLYLATDLVPDPLSAEDTAGIEVVKVPLAQITDLVASGKIEDSKSIAGLLAYLEYRRTRRV
ncbi:MAG TPA: NUDIX hydrolase [Dehalococcoidales bacterium]|nr:NUDIX hydrolase [Dehalococcoidales bacterium]